MQTAPTNEQLDAWAAEFGVESPSDITRKSRWGRYCALIEAAAERHGVDLDGLDEASWKDPKVPALEMVRKGVQSE